MPMDLVLAQAVVNLILIQTLYSLSQSAFAAREISAIITEYFLCRAVRVCR